MNPAETLMAIHLGELGLRFERQYRYVPGRRFRADFALPEHRLLIEVVGGVYTYQAHGSIKGVKADMERLNLATLHGWKLLRFTPHEVDVGYAKETVERTLARGT